MSVSYRFQKLFAAFFFTKCFEQIKSCTLLSCPSFPFLLILVLLRSRHLDMYISCCLQGHLFSLAVPLSLNHYSFSCFVNTNTSNLSKICFQILIRLLLPLILVIPGWAVRPVSPFLFNSLSSALLFTVIIKTTCRSSSIHSLFSYLFVAVANLIL